MALLGLVLAVCVAAYRPALQGPLVLDDHLHVAPWLSAAAGQAPMPSAEGMALRERPLSQLSFRASARISGASLDGWKRANLLLHLLCGAILTGLVLAIARVAGQGPAAAAGLAAFTGALWLLHPLHPSTVLYTVQRMTQLAALFCLAGLWAYVAGRALQSREPAASRAWGHALVASAFVLFLPAAGLSKENGFLLPLYLLLAELLFFRTARPRLWAVYAAALAGALALGAQYGLLSPATLEQAAASRGMTVMERALTEARVVAAYIGQILVPSLGRMGFYHDDVALSASLASPPTTALACLALAGLAGLAAALRRRAPLVAFGIALFFAGHALESTIFPLELMFEHRNYLPAAGLLLAAAAAVQAAARPAWGATLGLAALALFAGLTLQHARAWSSAEALLGYALSVHPGSPRVRADLAELRVRQGRYDEALDLLAGVPGAGALLQSAYVACQRDGALPEAAPGAIRAALREPLDYYELTGLIELGAEILDGRCRGSVRDLAALLEVAAGLRHRAPEGRYKLWMWLGHFRWALGETAAAFAALEQAAAAAPRVPMPLFLAAEWSLERGEEGAAAAYLARGRTVAAAAGQDYSEFIEPIAARLRQARPLD